MINTALPRAVAQLQRNDKNLMFLFLPVLGWFLAGPFFRSGTEGRRFESSQARHSMEASEGAG